MTERYNTAGIGRRKFIGAAGAAVAVPFAGCLDGNGDDGGDDGADGVSSGDGLEVNAAFFALYDLARNVARETDTVVDLVPVGSHGDDWEPRPRIVENIQDGDVFVYIDGFRRWSDDQAENIGDEVTVIDAGEGVEFIEGTGDAKPTRISGSTRRSPPKRSIVSPTDSPKPFPRTPTRSKKTPRHTRNVSTRSTTVSATNSPAGNATQSSWVATTRSRTGNPPTESRS